ncbi:MAG: CAF17-like 4Fe-4S cluster assembly/insertion protein YgfZ [Pirellulales bacterium]|jgi:folate-binding protein YgfZ
MPISDEHQEQYDALTKSAAWGDVSYRTRIELIDEARVRFLHNMCSNQINDLEVGQGCEAFITSLQGKIVAHVVAMKQEERILLETGPNQAEAILKHLGKYAMIEDVELTDVTADTCELVVAGPQAEETLKTVFQTDLPTAACQHIQVQLEDAAITLLKTPVFGEDAFSLITAAKHREIMQKALTEASIAEADASMFDTLRIEAGFPESGSDLTEDHLAQEANRTELAINFHKGCYLGQETVARIDAMGHVNKKLVLVKFSGNTCPASDSSIEHEGKEIAKVGTACFSPLADAYLALCITRKGFNDVGARFESPFGPAEVISPVR